ncbi:MAG: hypothetical protein IT428_13590 [Planctomycetaceae bacterium]|nr:hypothetical protein [Planctomycetaceae bacterium]
MSLATPKERAFCAWLMTTVLYTAFVMCVVGWTISKDAEFVVFDTEEGVKDEIHSADGRLIIARMWRWKWQDGPGWAWSGNNELPDGPVTQAWIGFHPDWTLYWAGFEYSYGAYTSPLRPAPPDEPSVAEPRADLMLTVRYRLISLPWWLLTFSTGLLTAFAFRTATRTRQQLCGDSERMESQSLQGEFPKRVAPRVRRAL